MRRGCRFGLNSRIDRWCIEPVHGLFVSSRNQIPVTVHRDLNRGVAQLFFHVYWTFAVLQKQRDERVAQIMEPHLTQSCLFE